MVGAWRLLCSLTRFRDTSILLILINRSPYITQAGRCLSIEVVVAVCRCWICALTVVALEGDASSTVQLKNPPCHVIQEVPTAPPKQRVMLVT